MKKSKITSVEDRDGKIFIRLETEGEISEVEMSTMDVQTLVGTLAIVHAAAANSPLATHWHHDPVHLIQVEQDQEMVCIRPYVSQKVCHEYRVLRDTGLGRLLVEFADRFAALQVAQQTHPPQSDRLS